MNPASQQKLRVVPDVHTARKVTEQYTVPIETILDGDIREVDFLVDLCVPRGSIGLITGESGCGKTWVAYDLLHAVASGTSWLGRGKPLPEPEVCLALNYDNPTNEVKRRLVQMGFTRDMPIYFHTEGYTSPSKTSEPMLKLPDEQSRIKMIIDQLQPSLILVDTHRQMHLLDEADSQAMAQINGCLKEWIAMPSKPAVIVLHHTAKSKENQWHANARGSGEIVSSADFVIEVVMDGDENKSLEWKKHRAWEIGKTKTCKIEIVDKLNEEAGHEDEFRVDVRATSALPGEKERERMEKVIAAMLKRPRSLSELTSATKLKVEDVRDAIMRARRRGLAKYERGSSEGWVRA